MIQKEQIWGIMDEISALKRELGNIERPQHRRHYNNAELCRSMIEEKMILFDKSEKGRAVLSKKKDLFDTLFRLYNEIEGIHWHNIKLYYENDVDIKNLLNEMEMSEFLINTPDIFFCNEKKKLQKYVDSFPDKQKEEIRRYADIIIKYREKTISILDKTQTLYKRMKEEIGKVQEYTENDVLNMNLEIGKEYEVFGDNGWEMAVFIKTTKKNIVFEKSICGGQRLIKFATAGYMIRITGKEKKHIDYSRQRPEFMW